MIIEQLASNGSGDALNALQQFSIWQKDAESLTGQQLLAHYTLIKNKLGVHRALELMSELKGEAMLALMLGDINDCPLVYFRPPVEDLIAPRLLSFMQSLPFNQRACILVALAESQPLDRMAKLTWTDVSLNAWSDLSKRIFGKVPTRLGCDYVFWEENTIGQPQPVVNLPTLLAHELDVSWFEFETVASGLIQFEHFAYPDIQQLIFS